MCKIILIMYHFIKKKIVEKYNNINSYYYYLLFLKIKHNCVRFVIIHVTVNSLYIFQNRLYCDFYDCKYL